MASRFLSSILKSKGREYYNDWALPLICLVLGDLAGCIDGKESDETKVKKAKTKLILSIDGSLYVHIKEAKTAKMWDKLKKLSEDTDFTRKIGLLCGLISCRLEECDTMEVYMSTRC